MFKFCDNHFHNQYKRDVDQGVLICIRELCRKGKLVSGSPQTQCGQLTLWTPTLKYFWFLDCLIILIFLYTLPTRLILCIYPPPLSQMIEEFFFRLFLFTSTNLVACIKIQFESSALQYATLLLYIGVALSCCYETVYWNILIQFSREFAFASVVVAVVSRLGSAWDKEGI